MVWCAARSRLFLPPQASASEVVPNFTPPVTINLGSMQTHSFGIAAGDIGGPTAGTPEDLWPDLVVAKGGVSIIGRAQLVDPGNRRSTIAILRNTGNWANGATHFNVEERQVCDSCHLTDVALADIDGDGDLDIVATAGWAEEDGTSDPGWGIYWIRNEGGGQFSQTVGHSSPGFPLRGVALADLNADTRLDVVAAVDTEYEGSPDELDRVFVWYNVDGAPLLLHEVDLNLTWEPERQPPNDVVVGAFVKTPESPWPDIVSANSGDNSLSTLDNQGFQNFVVNTIPGCAQNYSWAFYSITSGVFGPGSHLDIAGVEIESNFVLVQHGDGLGGFTQNCDPYTSPDAYLLSPPNGQPLRTFVPRDITSGHLNGGVKPDLVATMNLYGSETDPDYVALLMGKGDGTFQHVSGSTQYYKAVPNGSWPVKVLVADLTRDGFGDIIMSNHNSNSVSVLVNMMLVISP